jgi:juvenile hormone epoxide hydrolase
MMEFSKILIGILLLIIAFFYQTYQKLSKNLPKPDYDLKQFWGKGDVKNYKEDLTIKPFKVLYGDEVSYDALSNQ